jgi:hypothetical protein
LAARTRDQPTKPPPQSGIDRKKGVIMLEQVDKLTENYTIRVPEILKKQIDSLPMSHKRRLTEAILVAMARVVHDARFDPILYLNEEKNKTIDALQRRASFSIELEGLS